MQKVSRVTHINAHSKSFDFLSKEPDLYSISDLKKRDVEDDIIACPSEQTQS